MGATIRAYTIEDAFKAMEKVFGGKFTTDEEVENFQLECNKNIPFKMEMSAGCVKPKQKVLKISSPADDYNRGSGYYIGD